MSLGAKFGVDHTSILFQCRKYGVSNKRGSMSGRRLKIDFSIERPMSVPKTLTHITRDDLTSGLPSYQAYLDAERKRKMSHVDKVLSEHTL